MRLTGFADPMNTCQRSVIVLGSKMDTKPNKRSTLVLTVAIVICFAGLVYQYFEIHSLRLQISENRVSLEQTSRDSATALTMSEGQESRIKLLESTANQASRRIDFPPIDKLNALQPGYYQLNTSTQFDPDFEESSPYTITHVVVELRYKSYGTKLNVGLAISGMIPTGAYFDHDNDGEIDVDMALDFVRDIPVFGGRLAKAYDPVVAQNLYSIFVNEAGNADYTSIDDLANDAEAASSYLWTFVESQHEAIEAWVLKNATDQPNEQ